MFEHCIYLLVIVFAIPCGLYDGLITSTRKLSTIYSISCIEWFSY